MFIVAGRGSWITVMGGFEAELCACPNFTDKSFHDDLAAFCRGAIVTKEISDSVRTILEDVRNRGDEAVSYFRRQV
jgi:hypothetical protein